MKNIFFIFIILIFISCSDSVKQQEQAAETFEQRINRLLNAPAIKVENPSSIIVGEWDCLHLGEILSANRHSLPSKFLFRDNGTYEYKVIISRTLYESNGTFIFDKNSKPVMFKLNQIFPRSRIYSGIIEFVSDKIFRTIFYAQDFSPLPIDFQKRNTQIFEKIG